MLSLAARATRSIRGFLHRADWWLRAVPACGSAYAANWMAQRHYRRLDAAAVRATRTSDTVYVFGSGRSILDITPAQWAVIADANTVSLREFPRQHFVRADYHVTGEIDDLDEYARRLRENPRYRHTVFVVQEGWRALGGNRLIGRRLLPAGAAIFRYRRRARGRYRPPTTDFAEGLVHGHGTIVGVVNFAFLMGWRRIVLAGVDLYDKGYFWMAPGETRAYEKAGLTSTSRFTGADDIVTMLARWGDWLAARGVELSVLNPRSLLAGSLPVHRLPGDIES